MFSGRKLVIATKHKKEEVIAPLLEQSLEVKCFTPTNFDTDAFGTFSGEVERELDPISTARKKCLYAMEESNTDLGIASEGSFGPHPALFFTNADEEVLIFIDKKNNIEIIAREVSTETNFDGKEIHTEKELLEFANTLQFPSHGLILRQSKDDTKHLIKGIITVESLQKSYQAIADSAGSAFVETDMRALYNPSRMKVIEVTAKKLVAKINSKCPQCAIPGFDITDRKAGLPCGLCGSPTHSTHSYISSCKHCDYTKEDLYSDGKEQEEPIYCNFCNP